MNGYWDGVSWQIDLEPGNNEMYLPRQYNGRDIEDMSYGRTIVHELGHYIFGFHDEYGYYPIPNVPLGLIEYLDNDKDWSSLMTNNVWYMSYHHWYVTWNLEHLDLQLLIKIPGQFGVRDMSCWEWFVKQMGAEKSKIHFDSEARLDSYRPYSSYRDSVDVTIDINFDFSRDATDTFQVKYYQLTPPSIDIIPIMEFNV